MTSPLAFRMKDASAYSGLGLSSLYKAIREGRLAARKAGKRTLILGADLEAYLESLPTKQAA